MSHVIFWNSNDTTDAGGVPTRSIGPYRLSSWINSHGYSSRVIDFCHRLTTDQLVDITSKLITSDTVAIGVSTTFWYNWARRVISRSHSIKKDQSEQFFEPDWVVSAREVLERKFPNIKWLLGGSGVNDWTSQVSPRPERFTWQKFHGHSEDSLLKYLDENTKKIVTRNNFDICSADRVFNDYDCILPQEVLPIELARGCQFKCKFCRYPLLGRKKNTYIRDSELVEKELLYNYEHFGTTRYCFLDDTVNESEEKIIALAEIAQRLPFKLEWVGYNRLDLIGVRPYTANVLKDSGIRGSFFGIESFHPESSKMVGKGWNGAKGKEFLLELQEIWKDEANFQLGFIVGIGEETRENLFETRQWCIDNLHASSWTFNPLSLMKNANLIEFPSIFDLEHESYGYTFPDQNKIWNWHNSTWTYEKAIQTAKDLNDAHSSKFQKYAGFPATIVASAGFTFKELMQTPIYTINKDIIGQRSGLMLISYVQKMLK